MAVPRYGDLLNPLLQAIKRLGGSASIAELDEEVTKAIGLTEANIAIPHDERQTELEYQLAWGRTYLKAFGLLDNSSRGIWTITAAGKNLDTVDPNEVKRLVRDQFRRKRRHGRGHGGITEAPDMGAEPPVPQPVAEQALEETWRHQLIETLYQLTPDAFERLCQRLLRESGFVQVTVRGRTGDGGIDGVGIVRIGGLLGFPVLFQCKRYRGSVSAGVIRDFRGAMTGRSDRGLVLTTGSFTRDAKIEATRDGAPPIDLVDGDQLLDKLRELRLGVEVRVRTIEDVSVLPLWFDSI